MVRKSRSQPTKTSAPKREMHTAPPSRQAHTAAAPAPVAAAPVVQPSVGMGGGMMQQIASVAVGSAIGHTVGRAITGTASALFGGSSEAPASQTSQTVGCEADSKAFIDCMSKNNNELSTCQFYMDMLKACQENKRF